MSANKKVVVVYRSKSGYTKEYANWIAEDLKCDIYEASKLKVSDLSNYDTIIYGGGIYASMVNGVKLITQNYEVLKNKKLIVFGVGSSREQEDTVEGYRKVNIKAEQQDQIKFFYLRGGFDYSKLSPINKLMMSFIRKMLNKKKDPSEGDKELLDCFINPKNFATKANIVPIIQSVLS